MLIKRVLLLFLVFLITACSAPGLAALPASALSNVSARPNVLVTVSPNATPTPTPFQPIPPTAVFYPTDIPTPIATETPTPPPTPLPTDTPSIPDDLGEMPKGITRVLLLGSDQREGDPGFRTDTIILATINPQKGFVSLLSFPRDLYVNIPGYGTNRINTAFVNGGFKTLAATLNSNFGVDPDFYVLINFHSFQQTVDSLGGIDVQVAKTFTDKRQGFGNYTVPAGEVHMNGRVALWYVRARKSTNDFNRARRQQEVLLAIADKLVSMDGLRRAPELFDMYKRTVSTNMRFTSILPLLPLAAEIVADRSRILHYYIGPGEVWDYITPEGGMVLLPQSNAIRDLVRRATIGK
jgi:LCP family protein required for cell wall assembly